MKIRDFIKLPLIGGLAGLAPSLIADTRKLSKEDKPKYKRTDYVEMVIETSFLDQRDDKKYTFTYKIAVHLLIYNDRGVYKPVNDKLIIEAHEFHGMVIEELYYKIPLESLGFTMRTQNGLHNPVWVDPDASDVTIVFPDEIVRFRRR